jgi:sulfate adenylyltransferase subunit 1 (EFTu-like GTPase family)
MNEMMTVLRIVGPLFVLVLALITIALREKWWRLHDGRTKRHKYIVRLLVVLTSLVAISSVCLAWADYKDSIRLALKVDTLLAANQELSSQVDLKTTQIVALSEANAKLSQNISDSITGGTVTAILSTPSQMTPPERVMRCGVC